MTNQIRFETARGNKFRVIFQDDISTYIPVVDGVVVHGRVMVYLLGEPPQDDVARSHPLSQVRTVNTGFNCFVSVLM